MTRPSDKEFKLFRKIRDLEEVINKLKVENEILKKKLEKDEPKKTKKQVKSQGGCPACDSPIKVTELPFGKLRICTAACGWRIVDKD